MKKKSASRRKKLPLLLGALLILSVAAYGTRAYFSDSAQMQGDISLSLGNVNIETKDTPWNYASVEGTNFVKLENKRLGKAKENQDKEYDSIFTNVRVGDSFTREFKITNEGSLDAKVNLSMKLENGTNIDLSSIKDDSYPVGPYIITITGLQSEFTLKGVTNNIVASEEFNVTITVDPNIGDLYNAGHEDNTVDPDELVFDYLNQAIQVEAVQDNAK